MEQFFLEALEQIKEEIRKKVQHEKKLKTANAVASNMGQGAYANDQSMSGNVDMSTTN